MSASGWRTGPARPPARPDARPSGAPEPGRDHLFYVIHRDAAEGMRIDPWRARLNLDGRIGRNAREYREGTASAEGGFVTAEDAALLGRLRHYERGGWPRGYDWPDGEELVGLVRGIVETGRGAARRHPGHGAVVGGTAALRVRLGGRRGRPAAGRGARRRGLAIGAAALPDAAVRSTLRPARSGLPRPACRRGWPPGSRPRRRSSAARLPPSRRNCPASASTRRCRSFTRVEERSDVRPEPVLKLFGCEHRRTQYAHDGWRLVGVGLGDAVFHPCARLEFVYPGADGRMRAGRGDDIAVKDARGFTVIRRDRTREAEFLETLREAAEPHAWSDGEHMRYGPGGEEDVPEADIVFPPAGDGEDDASGAGAGFEAGAVPLLREAGWRIEVDGVMAVPAARGAGRVLDLSGRGRRRLVLAPPLAGGGRKEVRRGGDRAPAGRAASGRRMGPAGGRVRRRAPSGRQKLPGPAERRQLGRAGRGAVRAVCRGLPGGPGTAGVPPAPMRAGCPRWPRRWREAARPGPAGGSSSIWAPGCGRWPRRRRRSRPPR